MYYTDQFPIRQAAMGQPQNRPMTIEDIDARRNRLKALNLENSALGMVNDSAADLVGMRSEMKSKARDWVTRQVGLSGLSSAAGTAAGSSAATAAAGAGGSAALAASL